MFDDFDTQIQSDELAGSYLATALDSLLDDGDEDIAILAAALYGLFY